MALFIVYIKYVIIKGLYFLRECRVLEYLVRIFRMCADGKRQS